MTKNVKTPKAAEVINVASDAEGVVCNGGIGALGHPQVWYSFDGKTQASCHYCGRKFIKNKAE